MHSLRFPYRAAAFAAACLLVDAAAASAEPPTVPSPTRILKAVQYSGSIVLEGAQKPDGPDHSLSPYLYVAGGDPQHDQVPLKKTWAEVDIAGVIAAVKVHQIFENTGSKPIEAIYVFPASTRAAVHAMRMKIGARTIDAKIERKAEARAQYDAAKLAGKRASLLEQQRPNVFTTSVANLMPGDRLEVELDYSELVVPDNAIYEFVYPTVVGPRYAGGADAKTDGWMANPHLPQGQKEPYAWDVKVHLQAGIGLKEVSSPSHKIRVSYAGPTSADIRLDQDGSGNKDFVLRYRLAGDKIETGLLLYQEDQVDLDHPAEKFFTLLVEPPRRPSDADLPAREFIFLLDVSGSMHGFPLDTSKELMRNLLTKLRPTDHFNVACFSGANYVWSPSGSRPASEANIRAALAVIEKENGGGGTELMGGLQAAYAIPAVGKHVSRTVVVVTDGYVGVEAQAFRFIRERLDQSNLFAFGIGSSVNRGLIEGMARAGLGEPFVVLGPTKAAAEAEKLRHMIDRPVLTDIQVRFGDSGAYDVAPEKIPDLLAERPLLLYGKYRADRPGKIEITGHTGRGAFYQTVDLRPADARPANQALRALWARKWVEVLEDELHMGGGKPVEHAITDLGLFYKLLTPFTSFVAIDSEIVNRTGGLGTVRQPLPMPDGVSNYAVAEAPVYKRAAALAPRSPMPAAVPSMAAATSDELSGLVERAPRSGGFPVGMPKQDERGKSSEPEAKDKAAKNQAAACNVVIKVEKMQHLSDLRALRSLVERTARLHVCRVAGAIKLRVTVDTAGKLISVVLIAGEAHAGSALVDRLTGATSATRATDRGAGTVDVIISVGT
jgi:Ca-activated chloride channel family protein